MAKTSHVNLLFTKESAEKRKKVSRYIRYTLVILGVLFLVSLFFVTAFSIITQKELKRLLLVKQSLAAELITQQQKANEAIRLNNKAGVIYLALSKELPLSTYLKTGNELFSNEILAGYITKIDMTGQNVGIYDFKFDSYEALDTLLRKIDTIKRQPEYKSLSIEQIKIKEGTPSSSMLRLKVYFK